MASGMGVAANIVGEFNEMKLRKKWKWMTFKCEKNEIVIEKKGTGGIAEFKKSLPEKDGRYGVFDSGTKIFFVLWCPDASHVNARTLYASSKEALVNALEGVHSHTIQAHDMGDLDKLSS